MKYKYIDHTADIGFTAFGSDRMELFANCAEAFTNLMYETDLITEQESVSFEIKDQQDEHTLKNFLHKILILLEVDGFLVKRITTLKT
ncbi:MAG: archease [Planctomycetes bacterium]|nr:archease [Planctomycetota bacterium]